MLIVLDFSKYFIFFLYLSNSRLNSLAPFNSCYGKNSSEPTLKGYCGWQWVRLKSDRNIPQISGECKGLLGQILSKEFESGLPYLEVMASGSQRMAPLFSP